MVGYEEEDLPRFTLEEYIEYKRAPQWAKDGCDSQEDYETSMCGMVNQWYQASEAAFKTEKEIWQICYDKIEETSKRAIGAASIAEDMIAYSKIPVTKNTMLDEVAALYGGRYAPVLKALSVPVQKMIALANNYLRVELKLNEFDTLKFELGLDGFVADIWVVKLYTDDEEKGPFGENERIVMERIDPRNCYFDPKMKRMKWSAMDFFIVEESLDVGVARNRFPDKAKDIDLCLAEPDRGPNRWTASQLLVLPGNKNRWDAGQERKRIHIKECWLHDERMKFRAYEEDTPDGAKVKVDDEGYVEGDWEKAYPAGRMIVTAGDRVVLRDCANPYWHDGLPFEFCKLTPSTKVVSVGKAAAILAIERKLNDVEGRVHAYAQSEIERPHQADLGAFPDNLGWYKTTGQSRAILVMQPGKRFERPQPVETPQFIMPYLARLQAYKDQTAGQGGILRGDMPEGANLAAETIQAAQGSASSRMSMQSVAISQTMRRIGEKIFWLMRETYRKDLSAEIMLPDGEKETVIWDSDSVGNDFFVDVDIASNAPGGQQVIMNQAIGLKREGIVDRPYVLAATGIEGWEDIDNRMNQREIDNITAQGFGRSLGVQVKKYQKTSDDTTGPNKKM